MKKIMMLLGAAWFGIAGANQAFADATTAGYWSFVEKKTGACNSGENKTFPMGGLNNTSWGGTTASWNDSDGIGWTYDGSAIAGQKMIIMSVYKNTQYVPSYTKRVVTWSFQHRMHTTYHDHVSGVYFFETENAAKGYWADLTWSASGNGKVLQNTRNTTQSWNESTTLTMDNKSGSSQGTFYRYLLLTDCMFAGNAEHTHTWAGFKSSSWKAVDSYYKYLTFNANGGTGSMSQQTIVNSGNVNSNTLVRGELTFLGWNTSANGTGTAYAPGGSISATSGSKGPVTLYAQWGVCKNKTTNVEYATLSAAVNAANAGETIVLQCDLTENVTVASGKNLTLDLNGWKLTGTGSDSVIIVSSGAALTLADAGLTGIITGGNAESGGAVNNAGAFTMNGGTITNCTCTLTGGAVCNTGTFTMYGGTIVDCRASYGAGAISSSAGSSTSIYGGSLVNNSATSYGGAIYGYVTVNIYGGYFVGNTAPNGAFYYGSNWSATGKLYGGVFGNYDPTQSDARSMGIQSASTKVGDNYVVGTGITSDANNKLTAGTYTFNPAKAEYAAAGVALAPSRFTQKTGDLAWQILSGTPAGDSVWTYLADGVCTVYGTGATSNDKPLDAQWASVKDVRIMDGVTGLGTYFFYKFHNLTNVTIAASCTSLGEGAFFRCLSLESVAFEGTSLPTLGENALPIRAAIKMVGDDPVVTMVPKVTVGGKEPTLQGSNDLSSWENVAAGDEGNYHFFKYVVQ